MQADLQRLLKETSRSFYLSLRLLPAATRPATGLAYLLARAADTIADSDAVPVHDRRDLLVALRDAFRVGASPNASLLDRIASIIGGAEVTEAERELLMRLPSALPPLEALPDLHRAEVDAVLATLTHGMVLDLTWFPEGELRRDDPPALPDLDTLDSYCFHVAGVVGRFWTRMHADVRGGLPASAIARLDPLAVRFGIGLQLVNVIRDLPRDLDRGRCYVPEPLLAAAGLTPPDLRNRERWPQAQPAVRALLERAREGLAAGRRYCRELPAASWRLRLSTGLPLLIGLRTVATLDSARTVLDPDRVLKISRREVYSLLANAAWRSPSPRGFDALIRRVQRSAQARPR